MASGKSKLFVEEWSPQIGTRSRRFKVLKQVNLLTFKTHEMLTSQNLQDMINTGVDVTITGTK